MRDVPVPSMELNGPRLGNCCSKVLLVIITIETTMQKSEYEKDKINLIWKDFIKGKWDIEFLFLIR